MWLVADVNLLKIPSNLPDKKVILLSDILPTAWHANEVGKKTPLLLLLSMRTPYSSTIYACMRLNYAGLYDSTCLVSRLHPDCCCSDPASLLAVAGADREPFQETHACHPVRLNGTDSCGGRCSWHLWARETVWPSGAQAQVTCTCPGSQCMAVHWLAACDVHTALSANPSFMVCCPGVPCMWSLSWQLTMH